MKIQAVMNKVFGHTQQNLFKESKKYFQDIERDNSLDFLSLEKLMDDQEKLFFNDYTQITNFENINEFEEKMSGISFDDTAKIQNYYVI